MSSSMAAKTSSRYNSKSLGTITNATDILSRRDCYVGISRSLVNRLVQHLNFDSHYSASLVYRMASDDFPHEMRRDQAMKDERCAVMKGATCASDSCRQTRLRTMKRKNAPPSEC